jgi:hypothetical protein
VNVAARTHFPLSGQLAKAKVVELTLKGGKFGVSKVFAQHLLFQQGRTVHHNASSHWHVVVPFNNGVVVFGIPQHARELVQKLGHSLGMRKVNNDWESRYPTVRRTAMYINRAKRVMGD